MTLSTNKPPCSQTLRELIALEQAAVEFHEGLAVFCEEAKKEQEFTVSSQRIFRQLLSALIHRTDAILSVCREVEHDLGTTEAGQLARFLTAVSEAHTSFTTHLPIVTPVSPTAQKLGVSTASDAGIKCPECEAQLACPECRKKSGASIAASKISVIQSGFLSLEKAVRQSLPKYKALADEITDLRAEKEKLVSSFSNEAAAIERRFAGKSKLPV